MKLKKNMLLKPVMEAFHGPKARLSPPGFLIFFSFIPGVLGPALLSWSIVFTPFPLKHKYYLGLKESWVGKLQCAHAPPFCLIGRVFRPAAAL